MKFTHREDPTRTASVVETEEPPSILIAHVDAAGKARKKTIRGTGSYQPMNGARHKVLRFLLGEGFILRAPQPSPEPGTQQRKEPAPIQWMTQTHELYPHGFVVTMLEGAVWVGDTGALRSLDPGTCAQLDVELGVDVMPRSLSASDQALYAVLDTNGGIGAPPFLEPTKGDLHYRVVMVEGHTLTTLFTVPYQPSDAIFDGLSCAKSGRFVGPHAAGAALYEGATVLNSWEVAPTNHHDPKAAISPDGESIVWTGPEGSICLGVENFDVLASGFEQVLGLEVRDSGTVYVSGIGPDFWGCYRIRDGKCEKLSDVVNARASLSEETIVTVSNGVVAEYYVDGPKSGELRRELHLPWLGMAKGGIAVEIMEQSVIVRTDAHTVAGIHWL